MVPNWRRGAGRGDNDDKFSVGRWAPSPYCSAPLSLRELLISAWGLGCSKHEAGMKCLDQGVTPSF